MADVTGPISTLPGYTGYKVPEGMMCDNHPDRPATCRIQGETDSFGCEMADLCDECMTEYRKAMGEADTSGTCDWCKQKRPALFCRRDYEEGMNGRVYEVCQGCIDAQNKRDLEYLEELDSKYGDDFDYEFDQTHDYDNISEDPEKPEAFSSWAGAEENEVFCHCVYYVSPYGGEQRKLIPRNPLDVPLAISPSTDCQMVGGVAIPTGSRRIHNPYSGGFAQFNLLEEEEYAMFAGVLYYGSDYAFTYRLIPNGP